MMNIAEAIERINEFLGETFVTIDNYSKYFEFYSNMSIEDCSDIADEILNNL